MTLLLEMFTYPFIVRAFAAGVLLSLCAALLGVPLVLKRYSMIGDGLSHVSFGALSVALACGWAPLPVSIPVVIVAALGLLRMTERSRMGADAAIAVVSASSLAVGVIVTSLTTGMTTDVDSYMFGSILAMTQADVVLSALLCVGVLVLFVLFYHRLFAITFDENFSRATGVKVGLYNTLLVGADGPDHRTGDADDGRYAHLQSGDLPGTVGHAGGKELPGRGGAGGGAVGAGLLRRSHRFVSAEHPGGSLSGGGRPADLPAVLRCAAGAGLRLKTLWEGRCGLRRPVFPLGRGKYRLKKPVSTENPRKSSCNH